MRFRNIGENLNEVRRRIEDAEARAGRDPHSVTLVTVTKTRMLDEVRAAVEAGAGDLGENYVQELEEKAAALGDLDLHWHAIGHLQTNKIRKVARTVAMVHSVDSERVGREIDFRAAAAGRKVPILLQVNVSGEDSKFGVGADEALALARRLVGLTHATLAGLMTMPPYNDDPQANRPYFARLRELREQLVAAGIPDEAMQHLSMGMTRDYEVAVEEGATLVRVGTAIFGARQ